MARLSAVAEPSRLRPEMKHLISIGLIAFLIGIVFELLAAHGIQIDGTYLMAAVWGLVFAA